MQGDPREGDFTNIYLEQKKTLINEELCQEFLPSNKLLNRLSKVEFQSYLEKYF